MATYVISDIHGYMDLFEQSLKEIGFSNNDNLYIIGDLIDRGPNGIKLIQKVMESDNIELLLGNHEYMMIGSIAKDGNIPKEFCKTSKYKLPEFENWTENNGGLYTYYDYRNLSKSKREDIMKFLWSRPICKKLTVNGKEFKLCHSSFIDGMEDKTTEDIDINAVFDAVWRSPFRDDTFMPISEYIPKSSIFVVGHVPVQIAEISSDKPYFEFIRYLYASGSDNRPLKPFVKENIINIDGGCALGYNSKFENNGIILYKLDDCTYNPISFRNLGLCYANEKSILSL